MVKFGKALLAVLLGNLAYFSALPHLPRELRHAPFQIDLGMAVDAAVCLALYGVIEVVYRRWQRR